MGVSGRYPIIPPIRPLVLQVFFHHPFILAPDLFSQERVAPFSQHIQRGRISTPKRPRSWSAALISRTIRICSMNKPERAPARPALAPATDRSWHGLPPQMMSTGGRFAPFSFVMSPTCVMRGNRSFVTAMGKASISEAHTVVIPLRTAARGKPPMPSNKLPIVNPLIGPPPVRSCAWC